MYLQILKKDLKRKKTMNVILLVFIIFAATFIASSVNNMVSVITALDVLFDKAEVPDYWFVTANRKEVERFENFADKNDYDYKRQELILLDADNVKVNDKKFDYSNNLCASQLKNSTKIFNEDDKEITRIGDGEIYLTGELFYSSKNNFKIGDKIEITLNGKTKYFTLKGSMKDAMFGSSMIGITRFMISENDYEDFYSEDELIYHSVCVYTGDGSFTDRFNETDMNIVFYADRSTIGNMYIMDMVIAAALLIVSVCLILISMLILRFTINFTMSEEFREIGVMKAIGIKNKKIRGLYIIKYLTIAVVGGIIGFVLSVLFGNLMLKDLSKSIILSENGNYFLNIICALGVVAVVVLFCYVCTRKVKRFSPIDAIRNGENGERYTRKGLQFLGRSKIPPVFFMAMNDILSGIRRFVAMILIFTLGILLIIIPINTINTLQSDKLITWFNMAECDHVVDKELMFNTNGDNFNICKRNLYDVREKLLEKGMKAEVFTEVMFRMSVIYNGKRVSSLAFQGVGDVTTDKYVYLEGTAPKNEGEVGISCVVAENVGANIGDTVNIKNGEETKEYMVTAIYQTMNNMGEGIRFHQNEQLDYSYAVGSFGVQIKYIDHPTSQELDERKSLLNELFSDSKVYTAGEYINSMMGDIAGRLQGLKHLILFVVLCINILVTVLMVKSFIIKEKGEIAMLKAIGFKDSSLIVWQTLRIGMVLLISVVIGVLFSTPLSKLLIEPVFQIMGAQSIDFAIKPMEVYLFYPLVVLCVTSLAGMIAAMKVRKVLASETSNIE